MPPKRKAAPKENIPPKRNKKQKVVDDFPKSKDHEIEETSVSKTEENVPPLKVEKDIPAPAVDQTEKSAVSVTPKTEDNIPALKVEKDIPATTEHKIEKIPVSVASKSEEDIPALKVETDTKANEELATSVDNDEPKLPDAVLKRFDERPPGKLLIAGMVNWELTGRAGKQVDKVRPNLNSFHRFTSETYRSAVTGCCSAHSVLITPNRKALVFGRNQHGQLGQAEFRTYEEPTPVRGLEDVNVIQAACGRNHTLFLTDTGTVYACGDNRNGQCGVGNTSPIMSRATRLKYSGPPIVKVACGAEFSMILDVNGCLYSFGSPEYGQLGHNTDGKYFITASRLAFHYETSPRKVVAYVDKTAENRITPIDGVTILDFECGNNHTVAIDSNNRAFCWGFGGYGRLGHAKTQDEWIPRLNKFFDIQGRKIMRVFCGTAYSLAITDIGGLYLFGRNRITAEANMYPKPVQDLMGWNITAIGAGYTSMLISAEDSLIAWGSSPTYGELGLGDELKSTAKPKIVPGMEGMKIPHVAVGQSHSLLLVNVEHEPTKQTYEALPEFIVD